MFVLLLLIGKVSLNVVTLMFAVMFLQTTNHTLINRIVQVKGVLIALYFSYLRYTLGNALKCLRRSPINLIRS